jgi:hypothetical protein
MECTECVPASEISCMRHALIKCSKDSCTKKFHKACIASLQYVDIHDNIALSNYMCMECKCQQDLDEDGMVIPFAQLTGPQGHNEKLLRLGLFPIQPRTAHSSRTEVALINSIVKDMRNCMTDDDVDAILDSKPRAYPTAVKMSDEVIDKHVRCGRRFEISMRLYKVHQCDCCGRTQPGHLDSKFCIDAKNNPPPFEQQHLTRKYKHVWHCNCWGFCKGSQFYSGQKTTHIQEYRSKHNGQTPSEFLGLQEPNAIICDKCYGSEITPTQIAGGGGYSISLFVIQN